MTLIVPEFPDSDSVTVPYVSWQGGSFVNQVTGQDPPAQTSAGAVTTASGLLDNQFTLTWPLLWCPSGYVQLMPYVTVPGDVSTMG